MALAIRTTRRHRKPLQVLRDNHFSQREDREFDGSSYIELNSYQERMVFAGMIVALSSVNSKYVPFSEGASYGTGSDTAVGILHEDYDMTYVNRIVAPVWHGILIEERCYVYGGAVGTVPSAVKTSLDDVQWV